MPRYFLRCKDCLAVGAVDWEPEGRERMPPAGLCPCGGATEVMGRVSRGRLKKDHVESVCDDRCTNARGPCCDCKCGGKNHGSGAVVLVVRDAGPVPRYMLNPATTRALEYRVARREAELRIKALNAGDVVARKLRGAYLNAEDFRIYCRIGRANAELRNAERGRTHKGRLKALAAIVPELEPIAWDCLEGLEVSA